MTTPDVSLQSLIFGRNGKEIEPRIRRKRTASLRTVQIRREGSDPAFDVNGSLAGNKRGRRGLVLTDESAHHPFRATLPPHVKEDLLDIPAESLWRLTAEDIRGAASVYFATFAAVMVYII